MYSSSRLQHGAPCPRRDVNNWEDHRQVIGAFQGPLIGSRDRIMAFQGVSSDSFRDLEGF